MAVPTINESSFPLVFVKFEIGATFEDFDEYARQMRAISQRGQYVLVAEVEVLTGMFDGKERAYLAQLSDRAMAEFPDRLVAEAIVCPSALARAMFTGYQLLRMRGSNAKAFATKAEAVAWAKAEMGKKKLIQQSFSPTAR